MWNVMIKKERAMLGDVRCDSKEGEGDVRCYFKDEGGDVRWAYKEEEGDRCKM